MTTKLKQNWRILVSIQLSMIVGLPAIMLGYFLVVTNDLFYALNSVLIASAILFCLAIISSSFALVKRKTTIEYSYLFFGSKGMLICSFAMGISLFGWFIINLSFIGSSVNQILQNFNLTNEYIHILINTFLGLLITIIVMRDINFIGKFATFNIPLMLITLGYISVEVPGLQSTNFIYKSSYWNFSGIALILASQISIIIDMPTYYRFAASLKDAWISSFVAFIIVLPLVFLVGILLGIFTSNINFLIELIQNGGLFFNVWAILFLMLSGCMINNTNLYSCHTAIKPIVRNINSQKIIFLIGFAATFLSCFKIITHFELWLDGISILISSMASVMFTNFIISRLKLEEFNRLAQIKNIFSLLFSAGFGLFSFFHLINSITGFAFIDASLMAAFLTIIFRIFNYVYNFAQ